MTARRPGSPASKRTQARLVRYMLSVIEDPTAAKDRRDRMALGLARHLTGPQPDSPSASQRVVAKPSRRDGTGKKAQAAETSQRVAERDSKWAGLIQPLGPPAPRNGKRH